MSNIILDIMENDAQKDIFLNKYANSMPFDVVGFAKDLGLKVKETDDLPDRISGFIKQTPDNEITICVNKKHHNNRKRFTVAHELGHYFLHRDKLNEGIVDGTTLNREQGNFNHDEHKANEFAANLLMPEDAFIEMWETRECGIEEMAQFFKVSESAVTTRAKLLGLTRDDYGYFA